MVVLLLFEGSAASRLNYQMLGLLLYEGSAASRLNYRMLGLLRFERSAACRLDCQMLGRKQENGNKSTGMTPWTGGCMCTHLHVLVAGLSGKVSCRTGQVFCYYGHFDDNRVTCQKSQGH